MSEVSKGMLALRQSGKKVEVIVMGGERFCFKRLTIAMEEEIDAIVKANQDTSLKAPTPPAEDAGEDAVREYTEAFIAFKQKAAANGRRLTAELMRYLMVEEASGNPLFTADDDIYANLNNVYAESFYRAYIKFRHGAEATPAAAEGRFPN